MATIFENFEDVMTIDEIVAQFPVSREQIRGVLEFAAHCLDVISTPAAPH